MTDGPADGDPKREKEREREREKEKREPWQLSGDGRRGIS